MRTRTAGSLALPVAAPVSFSIVVYAARAPRGELDPRYREPIRPHLARPLIRLFRFVRKAVFLMVRRLDVFGRRQPRNAYLPSAVIARGPPTGGNS
jgi:hypothetical protein